MKYTRLEPIAKLAIDACKKANKNRWYDPTHLMMMVDWFITDDEALILRDMLWYARDNGVEIHMVPNK